MRKLTQTQVPDPALVGVAALNAVFLVALTLDGFGVGFAVVHGAVGVFPWICIAVLQRVRRPDSAWSSIALLSAGILTAVAVAIASATGAWAGACWDCRVHPYHDPPSRAFMFTVWTISVWWLLCAALVLLVLSVLAERMMRGSASRRGGVESKDDGRETAAVATSSSPASTL